MASVPSLNPSLGSSENKKRILVVEDDSDLLELLQDAFRLYGFEVDAYTDPEAAVNSLVHVNANYDLIIMDLKLDGIDGRSIYKKFK